MSVVTFRDVVPPARGDNLAWTKVNFQEAADSGGPWTTIETITLSPVDADPANPKARIITTENATLASGWYRLIFADASDDLASPTPAVQNVQDTQPAYMPSVSDVGALLRARTKDTMGNELGTFTDATRPNTQQVISIIRTATSDVIALIGNDLPARFYGDAAALATIGAAMLVELSFFPEQVASGRSPYEQFKELYDSRLTALQTAIAADDDSSTTGGAANAWFGFDDGPVIGRSTIW